MIQQGALLPGSTSPAVYPNKNQAGQIIKQILATIPANLSLIPETGIMEKEN